MTCQGRAATVVFTNTGVWEVRQAALNPEREGSFFSVLGKYRGILKTGGSPQL